MENQKEYGALDKFTPFQDTAVMEADVYLQGRALQKVQTSYTTAVTVQQPRTIEKVARNVISESRLAGSAFYYRWEVKNKKTGRKSIVQGAHASILASEKTKHVNPDAWKAWFREGQRKIAC